MSFNGRPRTAIYTLSLHDALPIWAAHHSSHARRCAAARRSSDEVLRRLHRGEGCQPRREARQRPRADRSQRRRQDDRSEEHTSELQSRRELVCRLLLEKKKSKFSTLPLRKIYEPETQRLMIETG